jgi:hypothetical protein
MAFVGYRNNMGHVRNANAYPSFRAPLTSSLDLLNGKASATFARSTTATVVDHNGQVNTAEIDEARFEGARRIQENRYSEQTGENSILFDGVDDTLPITNSIIADGLSELSVFGWVNTKGHPDADHGIFGKYNQFNLFVERESNNNAFYIYIRTEDNAWQIINAGVGNAARELKTNNYSHVGFTYKSGELKLFINGQQIGSTTTSITGNIKTVTNNLVFSGFKPFNGSMDNFKMWSKLITQTEVLAEYNSTNKNTNITAPDNLIGWWKLDDTTSTIIDYSGNGNDGVFNSGGSPATPVNVEGVYDSGTLIPQETLKGYLSEEQRTNLITWSEQLNNATGGWSENNCTVSLNQDIAPSGLQTADRIIPDSGTNFSGVDKSISGLTDNTVYNFSYFVKKNDFKWVRLSVRDKTNTEFSTWFDLDNGIVGTGTGSIKSLGNGWYRLSDDRDMSSGVTTPRFVLRLADGDNDTNVTGDGSKYNIFWGAQLEEGSFASSYIPTTTITITRTADSLSYGADDIKQGEGSIVATFNQLGIDSGTFPRFLQLDNGTNNDRISLLAQSEENAGWSIINSVSLDGEFFSGNNSYNYNKSNKIGISYKDNSMDGFLNGVLKGSDISVTVPTNISFINIGKVVTLDETNGNLKNINIFKKKLTNSEMQRRTN